MPNTQWESINGLLALVRWYLDAMRRHFAELRQLTVPLLTEEKATLPYEEMRLCARLDHAIYLCALESRDLVGELREMTTTLDAGQAATLAGLLTEYDASTKEWRQLMEAVQHVWADGQPPQ